MPLFSYIGSEENGRDTILLDLESKVQALCHKKAPVGTLGYRYDKAGQPTDFKNERRVCTLMYFWSERKLLENVEKGELVINRTLRGCPKIAYADTAFNMEVWDPNTWLPVELD